MCFIGSRGLRFTERAEEGAAGGECGSALIAPQPGQSATRDPDGTQRLWSYLSDKEERGGRGRPTQLMPRLGGNGEKSRHRARCGAPGASLQRVERSRGNALNENDRPRGTDKIS